MVEGQRRKVGVADSLVFEGRLLSCLKRHPLRLKNPRDLLMDPSQIVNHRVGAATLTSGCTRIYTTLHVQQ